MKLKKSFIVKQYIALANQRPKKEAKLWYPTLLASWIICHKAWQSKIRVWSTQERGNKVHFLLWLLQVKMCLVSSS